MVVDDDGEDQVRFVPLCQTARAVKGGQEGFNDQGLKDYIIDRDILGKLVSYHGKNVRIGKYHRKFVMP